jgi:hypothetical protein
LISWGLPGIAAVLILITNVIDGDPFTGLCTVGNLKPEALMRYLAIPQAVMICKLKTSYLYLNLMFSNRILLLCLWICFHPPDSVVHQRTTTDTEQI